MTIFGTPHETEPEITDAHVGAVLIAIKQQRRKSQLMLIAPAALIAAVAVAVVAAPPQYGELAMVADADATDSTEPWVFGKNGVWSFAEPIAADSGPTATQPPAIEIPVRPESPSFALQSPKEGSASSLPVPVSPPPTPAPGESLAESSVDDFTLPVRLVPSDGNSDSHVPLAADPAMTDATSGLDPEDLASSTTATADEPVTADGTVTAVLPDGFFEGLTTVPVPATSVAGDTTTNLIEPDRSVTEQREENTVHVDDVAASEAATAYDEPGPYPSTPSAIVSADDSNPAASNMVQFDRVTVLVHSAHVSVTAHVVDDDSSVIDWCNTFVDWGDGSTTGVIDPDGVAVCTASCEPTATASAVRDEAPGISARLTFVHEYATEVDAAPVIWVATGDHCQSRQNSFELNSFSVRPY